MCSNMLADAPRLAEVYDGKRVDALEFEEMTACNRLVRAGLGNFVTVNGARMFYSVVRA